MKYIKQILVLSILILTISGCSIKGHKYKADFNSINELKDANLKSMNIQKDTLNNDKNEQVSLRAMNMTSPYGGSFSKYLEISLEEQLKQSSLYDDKSSIKISTILLKNDVDISGFSIGEANLSAQFIVTINNNKMYKKIHTIHYEWDSSFIGQIAIENALANYPIAMQHLINKFMQDKELIELIKQ